MKHIYFGPGIDSEKKSEFWHGNLWCESPLFEQHEIFFFFFFCKVVQFVSLLIICRNTKVFII
jgi:hypothetical protein